MPDIKLFNIKNVVSELTTSISLLERELQSLIENNMPVFFGVTFLKSEYTTSNGGRMDSVGIDENYCPVIFEYKRSLNENVINQGLFYLDWLLDHKADFELLVMNALGKEVSDRLDWSMPRLICIAGNFTRYDEHAVNQINRNIDLVRYIKFGSEHILFELINSTTTAPIKETIATSVATVTKSNDKTFEEQLATTSTVFQQIYQSLEDYILSLGDDITKNTLKLYTAFKKMKNVVCVEVRQKSIMLYLRLNPDEETLIQGFSRDVRNIGHWGTGELEITIKNASDFEKAKPLVLKAYENN